MSQILRQYAMSFVGVPYRWGGETPMGGYDCSGLVQEILRSVGADPPGDQTANGLYQYFNECGTLSLPRLGALAFFGLKDVGPRGKVSITHVGFCLDGLRMLEAGGGGSTTVNVDAAIRQKAFVRIRPVSHRRDLVACLMPHYSRQLNI